MCTFCQLGAPSGRAFAEGCTRTTYMVPEAHQARCVSCPQSIISYFPPCPRQGGWCSWGMWGWLASCPITVWAGVHVSKTCPVHTEGIGDLKALATGRALGHLEVLPLSSDVLPAPPQAHPGQRIHRKPSPLHVEKINQPGSHHHQKVFGQVKGTGSSLRDGGKEQVCLVAF